MKTKRTNDCPERSNFVMENRGGETSGSRILDAPCLCPELNTVNGLYESSERQKDGK
jgi:hypothetical protein